MGGEILISYLGADGSKDSAGLLKDYGFVLPGNPADVISFESNSSGGSGALLSPLGLLDAAGRCCRSVAPSAVDDAAYRRRQQAVLRSLTLAGFVMTNGTDSTETSGSPLQLQQSQQLAHALAVECRRQLDALPTTLEQDDALLLDVGSALQPRVRAAIAARMERKRLLLAGAELLRAYGHVEM